MKKFATLSMMAVAACAVDMAVENPYLDIFVPSVTDTLGTGHEKKPEHHEPHIKIDVWDTINTELMELMVEV